MPCTNTPRLNVYELLKTLSLEEKEELLKYLQKSVEEEKYGPPKYYLETQWERIKGNLYLLSFEPYIDDQTELLDVWDICEFLAKDPRTKTVPKEIRRRILMELNQVWDSYNYGLDEPMGMLEKALMFSDEE